jgi:Uncharacterized conserved protein (DUF2075).
MKRYYYAEKVDHFLTEDFYSIFGKITNADQFSADDLQKNTWRTEIAILKRELKSFSDGFILFEYTIPRIGDRVDNILIYNGIVFLLEFKVGESTYPSYAIEQVTDYALDLRCFHKESHDKFLVPLLICTKAPDVNSQIGYLDEKSFQPLYCNEFNISSTIRLIAEYYSQEWFPTKDWINSVYMPTPTIVEAAQALYRGHRVEDISHSDASAINLSQTTTAIDKIIDDSKLHCRKSICFITGVPGAGKTLAGLNISVERQRVDQDEHAVFLSGNFPLVDVLQEALARDQSKREHLKKSVALREVKDFIQIIHHFRDEAVISSEPPYEKVAIFDEAQRAWTEDQLCKFMERKKGILDFHQSEPEFLISYMNRHKDWAVIICLIGGGQEINTGEAGLNEWLDVLKSKYPNWDVYISDRITDGEYTNAISTIDMIENIYILPELHLGVSLRSFRSENVSAFVKALLDVDISEAQNLYDSFKIDYPIVLTRDLDQAKTWIRNKAKGTQSYGLTASSGALRLRKYGVWVESKIDAPTWFLNGKEDVRSSYFMEEAATEFDIQGLELDWTIVCWDANLRYNSGVFEYYRFQGTKWQHINNSLNIRYLKNAYRVLLTRARQGFVIFVSKGDLIDQTRSPMYYDGIYQYLKSMGIQEI